MVSLIAVTVYIWFGEIQLLKKSNIIYPNCISLEKQEVIIFVSKKLRYRALLPPLCPTVGNLNILYSSIKQKKRCASSSGGTGKTYPYGRL